MTPKIKINKKTKKNPGDIILLHMCVAAIMAAFIHIEYFEDISYHDLSSWCNKYTDAIGKLMQ